MGKPAQKKVGERSSTQQLRKTKLRRTHKQKSLQSVLRRVITLLGPFAKTVKNQEGKAGLGAQARVSVGAGKKDIQKNQ